MNYKKTELKIIFFVIILSQFLILSQKSFAAPVISDVFGTIQNNNTIIIKGTGLGTKVTSMPAYYSNFESETGMPTGWTAGGSKSWSSFY